MAAFVARGVVPLSFNGVEFRLPVENGRALDAWWKANRIETHCDRKDACTPLLAIRGSAFGVPMNSRLTMAMEVTTCPG